MLAGLFGLPDRYGTQRRWPRRTTERVDAGIVLTAYGGYDTRRRIFSVCRELDITAHIRVRTNSGCRAGGTDRARSLAVLGQLGGGATPARLAAMDGAEREADRRRRKERGGDGVRWPVG